MENNRIDLSKLDVIQLKAFAYDELNRLEMTRNNLAAINQELAKRQSLMSSAESQEMPKV